MHRAPAKSTVQQPRNAPISTITASLLREKLARASSSASSFRVHPGIIDEIWIYSCKFAITLTKGLSLAHAGQRANYPGCSIATSGNASQATRESAHNNRLTIKERPFHSFCFKGSHIPLRAGRSGETFVRLRAVLLFTGERFEKVPSEHHMRQNLPAPCKRKTFEMESCH